MTIRVDHVTPATHAALAVHPTPPTDPAPAAPSAAVHHVSRVPSNKTVGATVGSAISGIAVYFVNHFWPGTISADIAGSFAVVATFVVGYFVPPGENEGIVSTEQGRRSARA